MPLGGRKKRGGSCPSGLLMFYQVLFQVAKEAVQIVCIVAEIMVPVGHDQHVEWSVSVYESVGKLHSHAGINVVICISSDKQQLACQVAGLQGCYLLLIIRFQALVLLAPISPVKAAIIVSA
jgi:hypothetical protein